MAAVGEGRGGALDGRIYPAGSSNPPACHSPSTPPRGPRRAEPRPTRGQRPPGPASESPAHAPAGAGRGREEGERDPGRGGVLRGPLSWSSGAQEGAHPPSSLRSWGAEPQGGASRPQAAPPSRPAEGRSTSLARVSLSRRWGGSREPPARQEEGVRAGPGPRGGAARAAGAGAVTQPPAARRPGTLQQLEPPLLQERKAFVPQCQGCRARGRPPLPGGTRAWPHGLRGFQPSGTSEPFPQARASLRQTLGALRAGGPLTLIWSANCPAELLMASDLGRGVCGDVSVPHVLHCD